MAENSKIKSIEVYQERSLWLDALLRLSRNKAAVTGAIIIVIIILSAVFAPLLAPRPFDKANLRAPYAIPYWLTRLFPNMKPENEGGYMKIDEEYPLGADALGRDVLSRILYGARVSLLIAFIGPTVALVLGTLIGITSGFLGGRIDNVIMRIADVMYAFPNLLFIILMQVYFRSAFREAEPGTFIFRLGKLDASIGGLLFVFIGIGITSWMGNGRLARGQVLSIRQTEYIAAARAMGASTPRILLRHIMPNILGPMIIAETLAIPGLHHLRGLPQLHRPGCFAADAQLGWNDRRGRANHPALSLSGCFPRAGALPRHVRVQFSGRWPEGCARPHV